MLLLICRAVVGGRLSATSFPSNMDACGLRMAVGAARCCAAAASDGQPAYLRAFDDSIIYRLSWDKAPDAPAVDSAPLETVSMVTSRNEKYTCSLPKMNQQQEVTPDPLHEESCLRHRPTLNFPRRKKLPSTKDQTRFSSSLRCSLR